MGEFYQLYENTGETMNMEFRTINDGKIDFIRSKVSTKKGYPEWDLPNSMIFSFRYLDTGSPGIFYVIAPALVKEPLPVSFKFLDKEKVRTAPGDYKTLKMSFSIADPFLSGLLESYLKGTCIWIEDSPGRILVRMEGGGDEMVLAGVSNVIH